MSLTYSALSPSDLRPILCTILIFLFNVLTFCSAEELTASESFRHALGPASAPFSLRRNDSHDFPASGPCRDFSITGMLYPNKNNKLFVSHVPSAGVLHAEWVGNSPIHVHFPFDSKCVQGRSVWDDEKRSNVSIDTMLCSYDDAETFLNRTTIVMQMQASLMSFRDIIDDVHYGINVWTIHANVMPIWAGLRQINITASLLPDFDIPQNGHSVFPKQLKKTLDVVMLFPSEMWVNFSNKTDPLLITEHNSHDVLRNGCRTPTLIGLQMLRDSLSPGSRLVIANYTTSLTSIRETLKNSQMNTRAAAWYVPPGTGGMLWYLKRTMIAGYINDCRDSIVHEYTRHMVRSSRMEYRNPIAKHVCFLSRQKREKAELGKVIFSARNLEHKIYEQLVSKVGMPLVLNPNLGTIDSDVRTNGLVTHIARASITDQMRFVNEQCAVLFGVHGAGFAHTLALRPGTHVLEIHGAFNPLTYRNSAAVLNNVTYSMIRFNSTVLDRERYFEVNLTTPDNMTVDDVVDIVNDKLHDSIRRQEELLSIGR